MCIKSLLVEACRYAEVDDIFHLEWILVAYENGDELGLVDLIGFPSNGSGILLWFDDGF